MIGPAKVEAQKLVFQRKLTGMACVPPPLLIPGRLPVALEVLKMVYGGNKPENSYKLCTWLPAFD